MSQKSDNPKLSSERIVKDIRRATRKQHSAEEKIRIVVDVLRGEHRIAELCRRDGIAVIMQSEQSNARRRLLRARPKNPHATREDQTHHNLKSTLATPIDRRLNSTVR